MKKAGKKFVTVFTVLALVFSVFLPAVGVDTVQTAQAASSYKETKDGNGVFTNGKYKYYMTSDSKGNYYLVKKNIKTKKVTKLKKFKKSGLSDSPDSYAVTAVYGKNIYIVRDSEKNWNYVTYVYNTKKKKVIKKYKNVCITETKGKYAIVNREKVTDVSPTKYSLYKMTKKGLKKVKNLGKNCRSVTFVGKKVYYATYPNGDNMNCVKIWRISRNGKNKKLLTSFTLSDETQIVYVQTYKAKYCKIYYFNGTKKVIKKLWYNTSSGSSTEADSDTGTTDDSSSTDSSTGTDTGTDTGTTDSSSDTDTGSGDSTDTDSGTDDTGSSDSTDSSGSTDDTTGGSTDDTTDGTTGGSSDTDDSSGDVNAGTGDTDSDSGDTDTDSGDTDSDSGDTDSGSSDSDTDTGDTDTDSSDSDTGTGNGDTDDFDSDMGVDGEDSDTGDSDTDSDDGSTDDDSSDDDSDSNGAPSIPDGDSSGGPGGDSSGGPGGDSSGGPGGDSSGGGSDDGSSGDSSSITYEALYTFTEDTTVSGETYESTGTDENAVLVATSGITVSLDNMTIIRDSDDSTGGDNSSFYGVGASTLVTDGTLIISNSTITSDAAGGAGVFAYGDGVAYVSDTTITTKQDTSGGIHVAGGGTLYAWNLTVETNGGSSAAIRSDRGSGTMVVDGGTYTSNGSGSPAIYCAADITVHNATLEATNSEAICIEGLNTIRLFDCSLTGNMADDSQNDCTWNVILYQSQSGDSEEGNSTFEMVGGDLTAKNGGMFYTTNTESTFIISDVDITYAEDSEFLFKCTGNSNSRGWGSTGSNGADSNFTAIDQVLEGDVIWDTISQMDFYLTDGSSLTGAVINDESQAGSGGSGYSSVYIDETSTWTVTGDSTLTNLYNAGTITDADGNTVTITGSDGTTYVSGTGSYTITVDSYSTTADLTGASSLDSWETYEVEQP